MSGLHSHFDEKRMKIFGEIVRRYWDGTLKDSNDLEALAQDILTRYSFETDDLPFIRDHIRVAMGLDPQGEAGFGDELEMMKTARRISRPIISRIEGPCEYCEQETCECELIGKYDSPLYRRNIEPEIAEGECLSCGACIERCDFGALADKIEFVPVIDLLKDDTTPVFAAVAPAIVGQFGENITMGQLRSAFKLMGFEDMIEVALFADILTIKEAFEFNHLVKSQDDFFLTSCCCPVWFNMVKKNYPNIYDHMSPSVSPMIASGRILKKLYPGAKVVFIAPCVAKKAEISEPDLIGAIDYVINFRELKEIFTALNVDLENLESDDKDQASLGGRLYARTGGVSFSVKTVVNRLEPSRVVKLRPKKVHGVKGCKAVLDDLVNSRDIQANFVEGMGCAGGCVGGPRTNIDKEQATIRVNDFGEDSFILTPFDNLNVMKILKQLGVGSIEEIMTHDDLREILSRD